MSNSEDILVSIGIPTYNRADTFLKETLSSAIRQTYSNIEIIVSDNYSTDNTESVVKSCNDTRIRYYRQHKNIGAIGNMNFCLSKARGDYFLMLHDDDLIDAQFVEFCLRCAGYDIQKGIIIAGAREVDMEGTILFEKPNVGQGLSAKNFIMQWYKKRIVLFLPSILFNTSKLKEIGGFQEKYHFFADVAAQFILIGTTERVDVPDVLGSFRVTKGSFGKNAKIEKWCDNSIDLVELACSLVGNNNGEDELRLIAMKTSAERMYREALRSDRYPERIKSFYIVWRKFRYSYYPTLNQWAQLFPPLSILFFPKRTLMKFVKKINRTSL
jgi:glycosyltransferase involved in cell wall biosynthesis